MMKASILKRSEPKSLTAKILDAEQQMSKRQEEVGVRAAMLVRKIHQQMTAPATLLLAGGIGFIIGELTERQTPKFLGTADKARAGETTPLRTALNLMTWVHTLYTALPIAWIIKSFHQPGASGQAPEQQVRPVAAASDAAGSRRRSK
jgi:hypothetical protein